MEKILISSKPISSEQYKNYKEAKWMISELDAWDLNGRFMPKETGEKCHKSIIGYLSLYMSFIYSNSQSFKPFKSFSNL